MVDSGNLRNDIGYIVPLLLNQRLLGKNDNLVPPDFLIISHDKRIYGVEVGRKKEIQSGSFSLKTAIPTASIDTENSRSSDRCPICKRWIPFCDFVINNYSNFDFKIEKIESRCLSWRPPVSHSPTREFYWRVLGNRDTANCGKWM